MADKMGDREMMVVAVLLVAIVCFTLFKIVEVIAT